MLLSDSPFLQKGKTGVNKRKGKVWLESELQGSSSPPHEQHISYSTGSQQQHKAKARNYYCSEISSLNHACAADLFRQTVEQGKETLLAPSQRGKSNRAEGKSLYSYSDTNLAKLHWFQQPVFLLQLSYWRFVLTHQSAVQQILGPTSRSALQIFRFHFFHFTLFWDNTTDFQTFLWQTGHRISENWLRLWHYLAPKGLT